MQDIHTHLYFSSYDADRDAVIKRAHDAGIEKMFTVGCTVEESRQCVALADRYSEIFASVGLHPNELNHESRIMNQEWVQALRMLAQHEKVVAIGECGLEYYSHDPKLSISEERKAAQKKAFLAQIALAEELKLPLIIHCRPSRGTQDAYEDMFEILTTNVQRTTNNEEQKLTEDAERKLSVVGGGSSVILHCYMGDTDITKQFLTLPGVYFSFAGNITYPVKKAVRGTKDDLTETVKLIPLERMLAETDCPFLAPQAHRGERNEPAYVGEVVEWIALLRSWETAVVTEAMDRTMQKVFFTAKNGV